MGIIKCLPIATILLSTTVFADPTWQADIAKAQTLFEQETKVPLRAGHRIEATIFPGYYAVRSGLPGSPSAYFREDMVWLGNVKKQGWAISSVSENSPEGRQNWLKTQVKNLPLKQLIHVKRGKPTVAVIWSAPDCPFCRKLENYLEQEDVSAYVAPVGISAEGFQEAAEIYCASAPAQAWSAAMKNTQADIRPQTSCAYPRDMLQDIGFFFSTGRGATPVVIFADGSTITGWDDQQAPAMLREKIKQKIFFE